jgi:hypothetical protein
MPQPFAQHSGIRKEDLEMTDEVGVLIEKFQRIAAARTRGNMRAARTLFKTIKVGDFPVMPRFPTSGGTLANAETALFFIDLDWRDEEWCPRFWQPCDASSLTGRYLFRGVPENKASASSGTLPLEPTCSGCTDRQARPQSNTRS